MDVGNAAHRDILALIGQAERAETAAEVRDLVGRLRPMLAAHFAQEEAPGGLIGEARTRAPQQGDTLDLLVEQHHAMAGVLDALSEHPDQVAQLRALCATVRQHERREAELLAAIAYDETGALD
ncbi:MAG: hemerythrin domain-containing protein [Myxococcota bacterium]